jgi:benzaldehyde dehydrogenase (NAD)
LEEAPVAVETKQQRWEGTIFVGGEFRPPSGGATAPVLDKATREPLAHAGVAAVADVDSAVSAAVAAQREWAAASYEERAAVLRRAAAALEERADEIVDLIVRETGSIAGKAQYEVHGAGNELHEAAGLTSRAVGEILPSGTTTRLSVAERVPVGVVGAITPWNFPLILGMRVVAPALALGNAVVLKPSPETPLCGGLLIADVLAAAGLPAGVFGVVTGDQEIGEALVGHPDVAMIHFTGSSRVGSRIAEVAGRQLKRVSLELGGNNALVVLDDADLDQAAMIGAWSAFHYQGQTCITAGRHIVARDLYEPYVEALAKRAAAIAVGDPAREEVGLGPMVNERQRDRAHGFLEASIAAGARVVEGGRYDGLFYRPTVVTDVSVDMPLWQEEIFAPIAPVMPVDSDDEAVRLVNDTPYGLVNAVLTGHPDRGMRIASLLRSGMVHVNDSTCLDEAHVPFGGVGASGLGGRSGGESNLEEFTERRWISLQRVPVHYPY